MTASAASGDSPAHACGIRGHRRADVAAFGIGEHQHALARATRRWCAPARITCGAVRLEERHLRLDDREPGEHLNADVTEPAQPVAVRVRPQAREQLRMGIDARAERTPPRHRVGQPPTESRRGVVKPAPTRCAAPAATSRRCRRGCQPRCPAPPQKRPAPWSRTGCSSPRRPNGSRSRRCAGRSCRTAC